MAPTYLDAIGAYHRQRAAADRRDWVARARTVVATGPNFADALSPSAGPFVKVIAEVKRRSPSKGWLAQHVDAPSLASDYVRGGASALSVLTDEPHFAGSADDLRAVRAHVAAPILRKDFTVCENDVLDAAEWGASAVLLIAALLDDDELKRFAALARDVNLTALVEVHERDEALRALDYGVAVVGVNQRNLHTFAVDPEHAARVIADLPEGVVRVAESGLRSRADVENASAAGFHAVLVGESFVTNDDPAAAVHEFATVPLVQQ